MIVIGVDPGKSGLAIAVLNSGVLVRYAVFKGTLLSLRRKVQERFGNMNHPGHALCVVERMQVHRDHPARTDDLIELSIVGGICIGVLAPAELETPFPSQWKGSVAKKIHHPRLRAEFVAAGVCTQAEIDKIKNHNAIDAIGLAHYGHKRLTLRATIDRISTCRTT